MDDFKSVCSIYITSAQFSYNEAKDIGKAAIPGTECSTAENAKARTAFDPTPGYRSSKISHENR